MPRPKRKRSVESPPKMEGFKPFGIPMSKLEHVTLLYEEYEAFRLMDYEGLNQTEAAEKMNVSRPTVTRIYNRARKTIAKALVEGNAIFIEGGNYSINENWYRCKKCKKLNKNNESKCKDCESDSLMIINNN